MFGPILSALPAVLLALFQPWPTVVWVILLFVVTQQVESNVLGPRITGHAVGLHPLGAWCPQPCMTAQLAAAGAISATSDATQLPFPPSAGRHGTVEHRLGHVCPVSSHQSRTCEL